MYETTNQETKECFKNFVLYFDSSPNYDSHNMVADVGKCLGISLSGKELPNQINSYGDFMKTNDPNFKRSTNVKWSRSSSNSNDQVQLSNPYSLEVLNFNFHVKMYFSIDTLRF